MINEKILKDAISVKTDVEKIKSSGENRDCNGFVKSQMCQSFRERFT